MSQAAYRFRLVIILAFLTALISLLPTAGSVVTASPATTSIHGYIRDEATDLPLAAVSVVARRGTTVVASTTTDADGHYVLQVEASGSTSLSILAYVRAASGSSFLYAPSARALQVESGGDYEVSLGLYPAASIIAEARDAPFVEAQDIRRLIVSLTALEAARLNPLQLGDYVAVYDESMAQRLGLTVGQVIVPAGYLVRVEAKMTAYSRSGEWFQHRLVLDDHGQGFNLSQGQVLRVSAQREILGANVEVVQRGIVEATYMVDQLERLGLHTTMERADLAKAWDLTETASEKADAGLMNEAYADLREGYLTVVETKRWANVTYEEAAASALSLLPFLAFSAFALAALLFEDDLTKAVMTATIFVALLWTLTKTYVGYRLADPTLVLTDAFASMAAIFFLAFALPRLVKERQRVTDVSIRGASFSTFSIAKRSLKRRRLRTFLTITSMTVLALAFVAFTSFSIGRGLTTIGLIAEGPRDGLLIRSMPSPESGSSDPFVPLSPSLLAWLRSLQNVTVVSAKAENLPSLPPLGNLTSSAGRTILIYGVLGLDPALEEPVTSPSRIVKEGAYLNASAPGTVLISVEAARRLGVQVGERLTGFGRDFTLIGLFDDQVFDGFRDLDGAPIKPKRVMMTDGGPIPVDCMSDQVLVTDLETALRLPSVSLSRIDVLTQSLDDLKSLPRTIALEKNVWVWSSIEGSVEVTRVGSFFEAAGMSITVPSMILIADIAVTMLDAVYERRREIVTLSTIGLNPSHISVLFLAEACIIGVVGGGIGYILGLSSYSLMGFFQMQIEVRQKISAYWGVAALLLAVGTAVAASLAPTLKASVLATPSLSRRWQMDERPASEGEPWVINVPVVVRGEMMDSFLNLIQKRFQDLTRSQIETVQDVRLTEYKGLNGIEKRLGFTYLQLQAAPPLITNNELVASKPSREETYEVKLYYYGSGLRVLGGGPELRKFERDAKLTASFIRHLGLEWSSLSLEEKMRLSKGDGYGGSQAAAEPEAMQVVAMPAIVHLREEPFFTAFMTDRLRAYVGRPHERVEDLKVKEETPSDGSQRSRFSFTHTLEDETGTRSTSNQLVAHRRPGSEYYLLSLSTRARVAGAGKDATGFTIALVKSIVEDWNREKKSLIGKAA